MNYMYQKGFLPIWVLLIVAIGIASAAIVAFPRPAFSPGAVVPTPTTSLLPSETPSATSAGSEQIGCVPKFKVGHGPELTISAVYSLQCLNKTAKEQCEKVDIYRASTNSFGDTDGIPDCEWVGKDLARDATANWKTYRNEQYGFEVKYPGDWKVEIDGFVTFSNSKNQEFSVATIGTGTENEALISSGFMRKGGDVLFMDSITNQPVAVIQKVINGNKVFYANALARIYSVNGYQGTGEGFTALIENNQYAVINAAAISEEVFNQILSTFKFIEPSVDITGWKTYRNEQYGFEIKYPMEWKSPAELLYAVDLGKIIFSVSHPDTEAGDVGSAHWPQFFIRIFEKADYKGGLMDLYLSQVQKDEIKTIEKDIILSGIGAVQYAYSSFAAEAAEDITYRMVVEKDSKVYVLQLVYTVAGCGNMNEAFRKECLDNNRDIMRVSEIFLSKTLSTFKFIE